MSRLRLLVVIAIVAALAVAAWFTLRPRPSPAVPVRAPSASRADALREFEREVADEMSSVGRRDLVSARNWLVARTAGRANELVGGPLREDASPGNWTVRQVRDRIQLVTYDFEGNERVTDISGDSSAR